MRYFPFRDLRCAVGHAWQGGQALHVWEAVPGWPKAPGCFRRSRYWAHFFDADVKRLEETARRLGVRVIKITPGNRTRPPHIDLCGAPLSKALRECDGMTEELLVALGARRRKA